MRFRRSDSKSSAGSVKLRDTIGADPAALCPVCAPTPFRAWRFFLKSALAASRASCKAFTGSGGVMTTGSTDSSARIITLLPAISSRACRSTVKYSASSGWSSRTIFPLRAKALRRLIGSAKLTNPWFLSHPRVQRDGTSPHAGFVRGMNRRASGSRTMRRVLTRRPRLVTVVINSSSSTSPGSPSTRAQYSEVTTVSAAAVVAPAARSLAAASSFWAPPITMLAAFTDTATSSGAVSSTVGSGPDW
mmetsp:Transcript_21902/g.53308  ORF Transcript_21902/g.53308 Transcript_21902/m.53308 type:complete len:247 (+) Transcript_21902:1168-1908(+)